MGPRLDPGVPAPATAPERTCPSIMESACGVRDPPLHLGMLPAPLNFTGTSCLSSCPWLGTWAARDPQEGGARSEGSKLTSSGSAATSSHGHPAPKPRLAPRLQTLPAVPFPGLSKVSATKMPLAWEELEPVRKKNSLVPRDSPGCGCQGLLELVGAQLTSVGQRHGPSPGVCPVALSAWRGEAWVGGTAAFVLPVGKWEDSCVERCTASRFPAKLVLPGKLPLWGRGTTSEKARPRGTEVLQLILQMRKGRRWPPREGAVGLPLLQARLLCLPETRHGFEGGSAPFPHIPPRRSSFQKWQNPPGKTQHRPNVLWGCYHLLGKFMQSRAAQPILLRFSASPPCRNAIPMLCSPMGPDFPHPGVPCPVGAPLWEELAAWDCRTGLWCLVLPFQPQGCSQRHWVQHKVPPRNL